MNFDFDDIVEEVVDDLVETVDALDENDSNLAVGYEMGIGFYLMSPFSDQGAIPLWTIYDTFFHVLEHYLWSIVGRENVGRPFAYSGNKYIADCYHISYIEDVVISSNIYIIRVIIPLKTKFLNIDSVFQFFQIAESLRKKWRHEEFIPNGHVVIPVQGTWNYGKNIEVQAMWPCAKREGDQNIWIEHSVTNSMSEFCHQYDVIRVATRQYSNLAERVIMRAKFDYVEYVTEFLKNEIRDGLANVTHYNASTIGFVMKRHAKGCYFSCVSPMIEDADKVLCYHHLSVTVFRCGLDGSSYQGTNPMTYTLHEFINLYDSLYRAIKHSELYVKDMHIESAMHIESIGGFRWQNNGEETKKPLGYELLTIVCRPHFCQEINRDAIVVIQTTVPDKQLLYHVIPNLICDTPMQCQFMLYCAPDQTWAQQWLNSTIKLPNGRTG